MWYGVSGFIASLPNHPSIYPFFHPPTNPCTHSPTHPLLYDCIDVYVCACSEVEVLYGGSNIFDYQVTSAVIHDAILGTISVCLILLLMFVFSGFSVWLTVGGIYAIVTCFVPAYFVYRVLFSKFFNCVSSSLLYSYLFCFIIKPCLLNPPNVVRIGRMLLLHSYIYCTVVVKDTSLAIKQ